MTTSCGGPRFDRGWIPERTAVLRCSVAGRSYSTPSAWLELPVPLPPTGLFARAMDPDALDDLGFVRDAQVCAALDAPAAEDIERAKAALAELRDVAGRADLDLRSLDACACHEATRLGAVRYFPSCRRRSRQIACKDDEALNAKVSELVSKVVQAVDATEIPKHHWRMFGVADRPDRFVVRFADIVGKYEGGSEMFVPGMEPAGDRSDALVLALLEQPNVKAVVRQDAGLSVLVVRAIGAQLVFDHFSFGVVTGEGALLLGAFDDASIDWHVAQLSRDVNPANFHFDPEKGHTLAADREALEQVDAATMLISGVGSAEYAVAREARVSPAPLVDRVELSIPFGHEGQRIEGWFRLSEDGRQSLDEVPSTQLSVMFDELPLDPTPPSFTPARPLDFLARGQPVEHILFDGIHSLFTVLAAVEREAPGALEGDIAKFSITFPSGPLPGDLPTRRGLEGLRERLSKQAQRLEVERKGEAYELSLAPPG